MLYSIMAFLYTDKSNTIIALKAKVAQLFLCNRSRKRLPGTKSVNTGEISIFSKT